MKCVVTFKNSTGNTYYFKKFVPDTVSGFRPVGVMSYRKELACVFSSIKSACDVVSKIDGNRYRCTIVPYSYILKSINAMKVWQSKSSGKEPDKNKNENKE